MSYRRTHILAGILGGFFVIGLIMVIIFTMDFFNYKFEVQPIQINSTCITEDKDKNAVLLDDSLMTEIKKELISDMKKEKILLTPQEYTTNIVNYYNTALLILSALIVIFSMLGFVYLKSLTQDSINSVLNSDSFQEQVMRKIIGKANEKFEDQFKEHINSFINRSDELNDKIAELSNRVNGEDSVNADEEIIV